MLTKRSAVVIHRKGEVSARKWTNSKVILSLKKMFLVLISWQQIESIITWHHSKLTKRNLFKEISNKVDGLLVTFTLVGKFICYFNLIARMELLRRKHLHTYPVKLVQKKQKKLASNIFCGIHFPLILIFCFWHYGVVAMW